MKQSESSKIRLGVAGHGELIREARRFLSADPDVRFDFGAENADDSNTRPVNASFGGRIYPFDPHFILDPALSDIEKISRSRLKGEYPLLITAYLSPRLIQACRAHAVSAVDFNGRIYLIRNNLLVDRAALQGRSVRAAGRNHNIFNGKSLSIVKLLLKDRDKSWRQTDLVNATGASAGLVSRVVNHLEHQGYVARQPDRAVVVRDFLALIDDWRSRDRLADRATIRRYTVLSSSPVGLAQRLCAKVGEAGIRIALTQWIAAWLRHPYTEPVVCSAYVGRFPSDEWLGQIGLRPVSEAGNVFLYQADEDDAVWQGVREVREHAGKPVNNLRMVSDAQIVVDLHRAGLRADEQADALCKWEGFCRA